MSMHKKTRLAWRGSFERPGVGKAMTWEVLWHTEWESPMSTAMTIQNQTPQRGWSFR